MLIPEGAERYIAQHRSEIPVGEYGAQMQADYEAMRPYLNEGESLDIGCGLGGLSVYLAQLGRVHLLDGDGWADRRVGYGSMMDAFNDMALTAELMALNGVEDFEIWPIGAPELPKVRNVVSLLSWGWHYPIATYLDAVREALEPGGTLVLDVRTGTGGLRELERHFRFAATLGHTSGKGERTVWRA